MPVKQNERIWWLNPYVLLGLTPLLIVVAALMLEQSYMTMYKEPKFINAPYLLAAAGLLVLIAIGIACGRQGMRVHKRDRVSGRRRIVDERVIVAAKALTAICIAAYLIWFANFIRLNGVSALLGLFSFQQLSENVGLYRGNSGSISGVTTFTEFGVVAAILLPYVIRKGSARDRKNAIFASILLVSFSVLRSLINSERLGIIELLVPFVVSYIALSDKSTSLVIKNAPIVAIVVLVVIFGIFEYPRSWLRHYASMFDSYPQFVISRVFGYYTTAINNESMFFNYGQVSWIPYWSFLWFWSLPGFADIYEAIANPNIGTLYHEMLSSFSNPEFNNQGGLFTFWNDFSFFGLVVYLALGYLIGVFYERFINGDWSGRIVYPFIVLLLLELPRHFYLAENRGFLAFIAIVLVFFMTTRSERLGVASVDVRS